MSDLVELADHPPLHDPLLLVVLEGWIDAGAAAGSAMQAILDAHESDLVATFDADALLDHRARRPIMSLVDGVMTRLAWPSIELRALTDLEGRHVLALVGAEPDHAWHSFTRAVVDLALGLDVRMVVGMGAYPAAVPHTRDTNLAMTSPSEDLLGSFVGFVRGSVDVPGGIQAAIEHGAAAAGIPSLGLWAQVPHYVSAMPFPPAAIALIQALQRVAGTRFSVGDLSAEAATGRTQLDQLVAGNAQHEAMIRQLEEMYDQHQVGDLGPLPTGDELAAELQAFLRNLGSD